MSSEWGKLSSDGEAWYLCESATIRLSVVVHSCNPSSWEAEVEFKASWDYIAKPSLKSRPSTATGQEHFLIDMVWAGSINFGGRVSCSPCCPLPYLHVAEDSLSCPCFPGVGYRCATPPLGDELRVHPSPFIHARQAHYQLEHISCPHFVWDWVSCSPGSFQPTTKDNLQLLIPLPISKVQGW